MIYIVVEVVREVQEVGLRELVVVDEESLSLVENVFSTMIFLGDLR